MKRYPTPRKWNPVKIQLDKPMKTIKEIYHFEKFWKIYTRQNRLVSKWDDQRTDMGVFIERTLRTWFVGKFYQVQIQRHETNIFPMDERPKEYKVVTKYVYIMDIRFAYSQYFDKITIRFIEPHSEKIEEVFYTYNDFMGIKLQENEGDFRILKKFYPIEIIKYQIPQIPQ